MKRSNSPFLTAILAFALITPTFPPAALADGPSAADKASARDLMREGKELRGKNDHDGALRKFRAAYSLVASPVTALAVAQELIAVGKLVEARETLAEIGRMPVRATETEDGKKARDEAATSLGDLLPRIPVLEISIRGVPAGKEPTLVVDGQAVPVLAAAEGFRVNPGAHEVIAKVDGREPQTKQVAVKERERQKVDLVFPATAKPVESAAVSTPATSTSAASSGAAARATPTSPPDATASSRGSLRTVGLVTLGTGVVAVGVGGIVGLSARSKYNDAKRLHCDATGCDPDGLSQTNSARRLGNAGSVVFGVGAALAVGGAVIWLTSPSAQTRTGITSVSVGAGSLTIGGRF
jgi:hypothetical protein